jgi:hypothetical protein
VNFSINQHRFNVSQRGVDWSIIYAFVFNLRFGLVANYDLFDLFKSGEKSVKTSIRHFYRNTPLLPTFHHYPIGQKYHIVTHFLTFLYDFLLGFIYWHTGCCSLLI